MSQELTPHERLQEKITWAKAMETSSLLPAAYRRQPANLLLAAEYADTLGVPRMTALTGIHVIGGKPSMGADLMMSLVRRAGHRIRVSGDEHSATATLVRKDDPEYEYTATWTMERARQAGLLDKKDSAWLKYPAPLLRARAVTEVCRMGASEVLFGAIYAPEELGATVDEAGSPQVVVEEAYKPPATTTRSKPVVEETVEAEIVEEEPHPTTPGEPATVDLLSGILNLQDALGLSDETLIKTLKYCGHTGEGLEDLDLDTAAKVETYLSSRLDQQNGQAEDVVEAELIEETEETQ